MATAQPRLITVDEFLAIRWDDSDMKAELDNGVIRIMRMMAGGSVDHSRVQGNVFGALFNALRGSACRPHGSDMAVWIDELSLRYPDVSVFCGRDGTGDGSRRMLDDPKLVVEVLSPSTSEIDLGVKLDEYRSVASLAHILYIDPVAETVRALVRSQSEGWDDVDIASGGAVPLDALGVTLSWADIFSRR